MSEIIPEDIKKDLEKAYELHKRTTADYAKCVEFSALASGLLARLEDAGCDQMADKMMSILLECNPKEGAHCDSSMRVSDRIEKIHNSLR